MYINVCIYIKYLNQTLYKNFFASELLFEIVHQFLQTVFTNTFINPNFEPEHDDLSPFELRFVYELDSIDL